MKTYYLFRFSFTEFFHLKIKKEIEKQVNSRKF